NIMNTIDREKLKALQRREAQRFVAEHPRSGELYRRAQGSLLGGVPMNWMKKWAGEFPVFVTKAKGAHFTCADGKDYVDLCLGDTGAMTGHSPEVVAEAVARRVREGITLMLPTEDAIFVGEDLQRRFGLPYWQFALTATDANRFAIRIAPAMTNVGIILPDEGYWKQAQQLAKRYGSLFIADETHTICAGPGGCTGEWKLAPDMLVIGKAIGSGIPGATYGCSEEVAQRISARIHLEDCDVGGIGGTLAGNALSLVAMRVTLEHILTAKAFEKMIPLAVRFANGVAAEIKKHGLPWNVQRLGRRGRFT